MDATAPLESESENGNESPSTPRRFIVSNQGVSEKSNLSKKLPREILIVASKFKDYVKEAHDLSTSANVMDKLSDLVRELADEAAQKAKSEGRKTLMDRDF